MCVSEVIQFHHVIYRKVVLCLNLINRVYLCQDTELIYLPLDDHDEEPKHSIICCCQPMTKKKHTQAKLEISGTNIF